MSWRSTKQRRAQARRSEAARTAQRARNVEFVIDGLLAAPQFYPVKATTVAKKKELAQALATAATRRERRR